MRVLIYTHRFPPSEGGMQTQCLNMARGLQEAGKEVIVLAPSYTSDEKELDKKNGLKVIRIPFIGKDRGPLLKYVLGFFYLMAVLLWYHPNIVFFIHKETQIIGGMFPLFPFNYIVRATARPDFLSYSFREFWLIPLIFMIKRMYSSATRIICHSYTVKEVLERAQISMENVVVIGSGVEKRFLSEPPRVEVLHKLKEKFGIQKGEKVILTVARVVRRKGQDSVINALSRIINEFPKIKYLIVGDGDYKGTLVTLVKKLGLTDKVIFTGEIPHDDIIHFYDICDVFAMLNRPIGGKIEGLPNALLEAAARGKPIIAGANFGSLEVVEDGKSGYLVNPDNADEIRTAILDLLKNEDKALAFGKKGKERVQNFYTEDIMMNELLRVLEDLNGVPSKDALGRDFT
jgi:phosphatidylinositol alpha-1,6-mannosyltransferase